MIVSSTAKQVSIRLIASGGRQVKKEFNKVGDAAELNFKTRLSAEMAAANVRMAAFARRAAVMSAIVVAASAVGAVALVRSGLQTIDVQAKLAKSLGTTVAGVQALERAGELAGVSMGEIEQATIQLTRRLSMAAAGTGPAVKALDQLGLSAEKLQKMPVDERIATIQDALAKMVPDAERASFATKIFGDRAGLVFSRIDSATIRQAQKDMAAFGVTVSDLDAAQVEKTNDAISRLGLLWRGVSNQMAVAVAPALERIVEGLARATSVTGPVGRALKAVLTNLERLATYATGFASFLVGKWVYGFVTAAISVRGLATALVGLRAAIARTGIGLLVVGVGELVYRYSLYGETADLATEAQGRMNAALGLYARTRGPMARAEAVAETKAFIELTGAKLSAAQAELTLLTAKQTTLTALMNENPLTAGGNSEFAKSLAATISTMQDSIAVLNNALKTSVRRLGEMESADPAGPLTLAATEAVTLTRSLHGATLQASALSGFLKGLPGALLGSATKIAGLRASILTLAGGGDEAAASLAKYRAELEASVGPMKDLHFDQRVLAQEAIDQKVAAREAEMKLAAEEQRRLGILADVAKVASSGGGVKPPDPAIATGWKAVATSLAEYAKEAKDWGKGIGSSLTGAFQSAEGALRDFIKTGKVDFKSLVSSMLADLALLSFRKNVLGPVAERLSGGGIIGNIFSAIMHTGGMVGAAGGVKRAVPALAFANAPRMHGGNRSVGLRPDEVPAILQRGERVLSRQEVANGVVQPNMHVTVGIDDDGKLFAYVHDQMGKLLAQSIPGMMDMNARQTGSNLQNHIEREK
jgi:Lambda phage tail tape-measure protein (Tape_meas_lam_C)